MEEGFFHAFLRYPLCNIQSIGTNQKEDNKIDRKQGIQCTDYKQKTALTQHIF